MSEIYTWDTNAGGNASAPPDGFPENMTQASLNNAARELMASFRRWYGDPEWLRLCYGLSVSKLTDNSIRIVGVDKTTLFAPGMAVRLAGGLAFQFGFVESRAFAAGNTDIVLAMNNADPVDAATNEVHTFFSTRARSAAFRSTGTGAGEIATNEDIQTVAGRARVFLRKETADQVFMEDEEEQVTFGALNYLQAPVDGDYILSALIPIRRSATAGVFSWVLRVHVGPTGVVATDPLIYEYPIAAKDVNSYQALPVTRLPLSNLLETSRISIGLAQATGGTSSLSVFGAAGVAPLRFAYALLLEHK